VVKLLVRRLLNLLLYPAIDYGIDRTIIKVFSGISFQFQIAVILLDAFLNWTCMLGRKHCNIAKAFHL